MKSVNLLGVVLFVCIASGSAHAQSPIVATRDQDASRDQDVGLALHRAAERYLRTVSSVVRENSVWLQERLKRTAQLGFADGGKGAEAKSSSRSESMTGRAVPQFDKTDPLVIQRMMIIAFDAAREDDLKTIDAYLKEGFSANVRSASEDTLLSVAAYHGSQAVVRRLLQEKSIAVDSPGRMGLTALAAASFRGEVEIVVALLDAGANVNASNAQGQTALMFAALTDKVACIKKLLAAGADAGCQDSAGNTAASLAKRQGAASAAELLPDP